MTRYKIVWFLMCLAMFFLPACTDDPLTESESGQTSNGLPDFSEGYSLEFSAFVGSMGNAGTRADEDDESDMVELENYINPGVLRLLFFDSDDNFIFESKSRWMTQTSSGSTGASWRLAVPFFQYQNDDEYPWDDIVEYIKTHDFKIAILANRPVTVSFADFKDNFLGAGDFGYNGPFWGPENSIVGGDPAKRKTIFDLHHCQFDPVYTNKGMGGDYGTTGIDRKMYDFIMDYSENPEQPQMGAVSGWECDRKDEPGHTHGVDVTGKTDAQIEEIKQGVYYRQPTYENPIPMYGVQQFNRLGNVWKKGTTFNLSYNQDGNYESKTIYLLRSVVKLALLVPIDVNVELESVRFMYGNVYARCEPMDTWTPTEQLWKNDHPQLDNVTDLLNKPTIDEGDCEWLSLMHYGPIAYVNNKCETEEDFQQRLSWFYGVWKEKGWQFQRQNGSYVPVVNEDVMRTPYPRIFNPIVQRKANAYLTECYKPTARYHRWVVYCGERSINDPNYLPNNNNGALGAGIIPYFCIKIGTTEYNIPITNYNDPTNLIYQKDKNNNSYLTQYSTYRDYIRDNTIATKDLPWPLLRNHFYRLTVRSVSGDDLDITVVDAESRIAGVDDDGNNQFVFN